MAKKLTISFKETSKDQELYDYIMKLEDKSVEIKHVLRMVFLEQKTEKVSVKQEEFEKEEINILNF